MKIHLAILTVNNLPCQTSISWQIFATMSGKGDYCIHARLRSVKKTKLNCVLNLFPDKRLKDDIFVMTSCCVPTQIQFSYSFEIAFWLIEIPFS
jgi:hypothetical protein